jgi:hypothetical protein
LKRVPLWTAWDLPFLLGLLLLSWGLRHSLLPDGSPPRELRFLTSTGPRTCPLTPGIEKLPGPLGITEIEIGKDLRVRMLRSPCPGQLCLRLGSIHQSGEALVCVPNQVGVELLGSGSASEQKLDGVTQ